MIITIACSKDMKQLDELIEILSECLENIDNDYASGEVVLSLNIHSNGQRYKSGLHNDLVNNDIWQQWQYFENDTLPSIFNEDISNTKIEIGNA